MTIEQFLKEKNVNLTPSQVDALYGVFTWYNTDGRTYLIKGSAGTGKSFLTKVIKDMLREMLNVYDIAIATPTHQAAEIATKFSGLHAMTLHKLLGLAPNVDLDEFDIHNVIFDKRNPPKIGENEVIFVDEASMINSILYEYLIQEAANNQVRLIFIGDDVQLPPVKEDRSPVFQLVKDFSELKEIARQKPSNPTLYLLYALRNDIRLPDELEKGVYVEYTSPTDGKVHSVLPSTLMFMEVLSKFFDFANETLHEIHDIIFEKALEGNAYDAIKNLTFVSSSEEDTAYDMRINDQGEYEGFYLMENPTKFGSKVKALYSSEKFKVNSYYCKVVTYMNDNVGEWNRAIRNYLYNSASGELLVAGDLLTGYNTIASNETLVIRNSATYLVQDVSIVNCTEILLLQGMQTEDVEIKCYQVELLDINTETTSVLNVVHPDGYKAFKRVHAYHLKAAQTFKGSKWITYYKFKNSYCLMENLKKISKNRNLPTNDLDYAFTITVHKSQGSTYENCLIIERNIKRAFDLGVHYFEDNNGRSPTKKDIENIRLYVYRLLYVALSRATDKVYILC